MNKIAMIPGAGYNPHSMWPLQTLDTHNALPVDYRKGLQINTAQPVLKQYAENALALLLKNDEPVHLCGLSMGALVALMVAELSNEQAPGLVEGVSLINPGVFGGSIDYFSSFAFMRACHQLLWLPSQKIVQRETAALAEIRSFIPNYEHRDFECWQAKTEAIGGSVPMPAHLVGQITLFCSEHDELIPKSSTEVLAARAGVTITNLSGQYHNVCLHDTAGIVFEQIVSHTQKSKALTT